MEQDLIDLIQQQALLEKDREKYRQGLEKKYKGYQVRIYWSYRPLYWKVKIESENTLYRWDYGSEGFFGGLDPDDYGWRHNSLRFIQDLVQFGPGKYVPLEQVWAEVQSFIDQLE